MGRSATNFSPFDNLQIVTHLEANRYYRGSYKTYKECLKSIQTTLLGARCPVNVPADENHFSIKRIDRYLTNLGYRKCKKKTSANCLVYNGPEACGLKIELPTQDEIQDWIEQAKTGNGHSSKTKKTPEVEANSSQDTHRNEGKKLAVADRGPALLGSDPRSECQPYRSQRTASKDLNELDSALSVVRVALTTTPQLNLLSHQAIQSHLTSLQKKIKSEMRNFANKTDLVRVRFAELSLFGRDVVSHLVPDNPELAGKALDEIQDAYNLGPVPMLCALVSAAIHLLFQQFSLDEYMPRSSSVEHVVGLLGPGCDVIRKRLEQLETYHNLLSLKEDQEKLKIKCTVKAREIFDLILSLCNFTAPESEAEYLEFQGGHKRLGEVLPEIFASALTLRCDLALAGDDAYEFFLSRRGESLDLQSMSLPMEETSVSVVRLCMMSGVRHKPTLQVISKAVVM